MRHFLLLMAVAAAVGDDLPPTCSRRVYCDSQLLHHVQLARIFSDSKTFVDYQMRADEDTILAAFDTLLNETDNAPTPEQLTVFVKEHFDETSELEQWTPSDYSESPAFLERIKDEELRQFGKDINNIWPTLARKVKPIVFEKPEQFSFVPISHGFIIPGGRFTEIYYWDTYWIIEGLLISGMTETAKGMIENLIELLNKFGHIPNGSRWYYQERSQPPLLSAMMMLYYNKTKDVEFVRQNIRALENEMNYWLDTQIVTFQKDDRVFTLLRYYAPSSGPRPESYYQDYNTAKSAPGNGSPTDLYIDLKSAAESGWDFSSRWFVSEDGGNSGNLTNIHTRYIVPVDLNAIFARALSNVARFHTILKDPHKATVWAFRAEQWKADIEQVLWHEEDGIWYDYDIHNEKHRRYFFPSNLAPMWTGVVDEVLVKKHTPRVLKYLKNSQGLDYPGGIPTSLVRSGEQWDFPNVWPPEVSLVIKALEHMDTKESTKLAFHLAQEWVRICLKGFKENKQMFEKYDAEEPGRFGGGGEYNVQAGFGWSNGVVLECLDTYGDRMTAYATAELDEVEETTRADSGASTLDSLRVVPLIVGSNYMKNLAMA